MRRDGGFYTRTAWGYPQVADFTFYGGLYRDVNVICLPATHFDLSYYGGCGLHITPEADGRVQVESWVSGPAEGTTVRYTIRDAAGQVADEVAAAPGTARLEVASPHLWQGRRDPYLYTLTAELLLGDTLLDTVSRRFGFRSYKIDPDRGFFLNGQSYPLHGVSRHQDGWGVGNALTKEDHIRDMDLICEVGANTIRLAHYQHDQFFYDLCDERGMVVWAEIPYISQHMPGGRQNTLDQMRELIVQNHHHASIVVWGLSNEITMKGDKDPDLLANHHQLNDLCHTMDPTRPTVMAAISMCPTDSPYLEIPDAVSYNHYFGWYGGDTAMNGPWFDKFHAQHPTLPIGCSEYGCEALNWHSDTPQQGDYTEEYQTHYHEELIKQLFTRPYIWATHVWNMFDFGADACNEGGENGQNHKGLVTFDRKYKKRRLLCLQGLAVRRTLCPSVRQAVCEPCRGDRADHRLLQPAGGGTLRQRQFAGGAESPRPLLPLYGAQPGQDPPGSGGGNLPGHRRHLPCGDPRRAVPPAGAGGHPELV